MANALVSPYVSGSPQVVCPLYDPRLVRQDRQRLRFDAPGELRHANSFYCPTGRWPSRGWLLLLRKDYSQIKNLYRTDFELHLDDFINGELVLKNLSIVQARCVTRGNATDPLAIYLVEVTDKQGVLWSAWQQFPTTSQYNVRAPGYPEQFYQSSMNAGTPWTWDTMIGDLWSQMGAFLGTYPHLPITPASAPEGFLLPGVPAWQALNRALDLLGLTVSVDLRQTSPYGIVVPGAADATYAAQVLKFGAVLEEDYEYIDTGAARSPGSVTVYFHRRNQFYGTEETVRQDTLQWVSNSLYQVSVAGSAPFNQSPGVDYLWDDFTVRYDVDGNPLAADVAMAQTIAAERAAQYYRRVTRGTLGYMRRVYTGALPFAAGSQVDGVCWFQKDGRAAWRTELVRGPLPTWPQVEVVIQGVD